MASDTVEKTLRIKSIESPSIKGIIAKHLHPFTPFLKPSLITAELHETEALAEKFHTFIIKCISIIIFRLNKPPKISVADAVPFLESYKLCLDCYDVFAHLLFEETPQVVLQPKVKYIKCLEMWNFYDEAETEGLELFNVGKSIISPNQESAVLLIELVIILGECVLGKSNTLESDYRRVISMMKHAEIWLMVLDANNSVKSHIGLVICLLDIALTKAVHRFDLDLVYDFTLFTIIEYNKSSTFNLNKYKPDVETIVKGFLEHIYHSVVEFHGNIGLCLPTAERLDRFANGFEEVFPCINSYLRLYVAGLVVDSTRNQSNGDSLDILRNSTLGSTLRFLFDDDKKVNQFCGKDKNPPPECSLSYLIALSYFCHSLAGLIVRNWNYLYECKAANAFAQVDLRGLVDVFQHYLQTISQEGRKKELERARGLSLNQHISNVLGAALTLSFKFKQNKKEITLLIKRAISTEEVLVKKLKYLYGHLKNLCLALRRQKRRLKEAIEIIDLSCEASVAYFDELCDLSGDNLSEKVIADLFEDTSGNISFLRKNNQEEICKGIIEESFKRWLIAKTLLETLPAPASLIKNWVEVEYSLSKNLKTEPENATPLLYSLLPCARMSNRAIGNLLEEVLSSYNEMSHLTPKFSRIKQLKIINVLLKDIYVSKEYNIERSRILIEKGIVLRAPGLAKRDECIQCLSDAILILKPLDASKKSLAGRLLTRAYLVKALSTLESLSRSLSLSDKSDIIEYIDAAMKLCEGPAIDHADEPCEDILYLWYQVIDFLSLKGYLSFHPRLFNMVFKFFEHKSIPLEKAVYELWKGKRFRHTLCVLPVEHKFIENISKDQSQYHDSDDIWRSCTEELKPLNVGAYENEIKQAAANPTSNDPLPSRTTFLLSHLYHDSSKRLISSGQMIEALLYAKESHRLRDELFKQKFEYTWGKMGKTLDDNGEVIRKSFLGMKNLKVKHPVVYTKSNDYEGCILTPWNVLSCYLESILQVGVIQEILGNGRVAEIFLLNGWSIAVSMGLPYVEIYFSSTLGKLYRKQKRWYLAKKELYHAKALIDNQLYSCDLCFYMLEISIDQHIVNVNLSRSCNTQETLYEAKRFYKSALKKLNLFITTHKQVPVGAESDKVTQSMTSDSIDGTATEHPVSEAENFDADIERDISSLCNNLDCWHCLHIKAVECSNVTTIIRMYRELVFRKLSLRLLINIGKLYGLCGNHKKANELLLQSTILVGKSSVCPEYSLGSLNSLVESTGKQFPGDVLAVERATLVYYISSFASRCQDTGNIYYELSCMETTSIVHSLKLAFILSQEVPSLFEKISRFLSVLYVLSTSTPPSEKISGSQWASFFHQASLGTQLNQHIHIDMVQKRLIASDEDSLFSNTIQRSFSETLSSLRPAPMSFDDLEDFVLRFFQGLPAIPVICISLVAGADAGWLTAILDCSSIRAWILISSLSSNNNYIVLLPVLTILKASDDPKLSLVFFDNKKWKCPWESSIIDEIAPAFRHAVKGSSHASYIGNHKPMLDQFYKVDECLNVFLRDIENNWLGTWKYILLGQWHCFDSLQNDLGDGTSLLLDFVTKKCYVDLSCVASSRKSRDDENLMIQYKQMLETSHTSDQVKCASNQVNQPIILVLDFDVQMLPWENLPVLKNQEIYRMPSVGSISSTFSKCCPNTTDSTIPAFPFIDPLNAYYLVNPDGEWGKVESDFVNWFKEKRIEGKSKTVPTVEELILALKKRDLYIYIGHGCGIQYVSEPKIEELKHCAAVVLLGCHSCTCDTRGSYIPKGAPISYLMAGSPAIIGALWEVMDIEVYRYGTTLLEDWLKEREEGSGPRIGSCIQRARDACALEYFSAASIVSYGIPTSIIRKSV